MRKLFLTAGISKDVIRWRVKQRRVRRIINGVYGEGPAAPSCMDINRATALKTGGVGGGRFAGVLLGLDSVELRGVDVSLPPGSSNHRKGVRRRVLDPARVIGVEGIRCTDGLQTMLDLAAELDDLYWEQALESALRKKLTTVDAIRGAMSGVNGADRIRRVLAQRPAGAPPTESLLETLMVQLARTIPGLPPPTRQLEVFTADGVFVARVDLSWPELGIFIELDGQQHKGQPVYDAIRQTAVTAATGWLCGRFTWHEVVYVKKVSARRLAAIAEQARRRPLPAA